MKKVSIFEQVKKSKEKELLFGDTSGKIRRFIKGKITYVTLDENYKFNNKRKISQKNRQVLNSIIKNNKSKETTLSPIQLHKLDKMCQKIKGYSYPDFLNSRYWQCIRGIILKRDNNKCIKCNYGKNLQIHHSTYKNHFNEHRHLAELSTLCKICHEQYHGISNNINTS